MITGEHQAVMLAQAVDALNITGERANGVYVDGTFGRGGHSRRILELLGSGGRLIALDRDADAIRAGESINDQRFKLIHGWFGELGALLTGAGAGAGAGVAKVDGILLDLGVSSPQLDDAARGFSFRFDAPLDMRMDISRGMSAAQTAYWENVLAKAVEADEWNKMLEADQLSGGFLKSADTRAYLRAQQDELRTIMTDLGLVR